MPLFEKARVEVYLPDLPSASYQDLLVSLDREFTYTFGGCTMIRGLDGSYLSQAGLKLDDRVALIYTDTPYSFTENFKIIGVCRKTNCGCLQSLGGRSHTCGRIPCLSLSVTRSIAACVETERSNQSMSIKITELNHVQTTVPSNVKQAAKHFYGTILGLHEIPKPSGPRSRGGAWYRCGSVQLHLSIEDLPADSRASRRHVCFMVTDLAEAEATMREEAIEIIPDNQPIEGWRRFYVRDPGGNRIEIAERSETPPSGASSTPSGASSKDDRFSQAPD